MADLTTTPRNDLEAERDDLNGKLARIEADIASIKAEYSARLQGVQTDAQKLRTRLGQIDSEIARRIAMEAVVPTISDHALLRYMERVHGINVEALKADLLTDALVSAIKSGASGMQTPEGTFVIKGHSVVTFLGKDMRPKKKTKRGMRQIDDAEVDA